jgi:type IV secretory pathway VirB3-like protein
MMNKLGFLRIDPSTIRLDSCGSLSNDLGLLTIFVKQALLSILSTILLHVLRLISSMDREFQTWALFQKIAWVNHWIWGSDSMSSKIIRVGNSGLWSLIQIGSCETQASGLQYHLGKKPCEPQVFGLGLFFQND